MVSPSRPMQILHGYMEPLGQSASATKGAKAAEVEKSLLLAPWAVHGQLLENCMLRGPADVCSSERGLQRGLRSSGFG